MGESEVQAEFRRLGWAAHKTSSGQDNGTDLLVSPRERLFETGIWVGVQVKSGPTAFRRPKKEGGKVTGWWFIDEEGTELGGWAAYPTPHIVVLCDIEKRVAYWEEVTADGIRDTGKGDKLFVPATQVLGPRATEKLRAVAATFGTRGSLEGTWVKGYPVSPPDRLRYALIAPRLIAPHPNFGVPKLTPEQAIAMLTQLRVAELDRYAEEQRHVPRGRKALGSRTWKWRFFGALWRRIEDGDPEPLCRVLDETRRRAERAAASACLAAQMVSAGSPQEAIDLLAPDLEADKLAPVDHGWLAMQRARALAELGMTDTARTEAVRWRNLRMAAPEDQTAIAISASAAALYANLSEPTAEIAAETMEATDVATGWFRAQTVRTGLADLAERTFEEAMQDEREKWSREDITHNRLFAAALEAGHAGDQVGWARLTGVLGRNELLGLDRHSAMEEVAEALATLRLAGDDKALKLALPRICDDGPCLAVTAALKALMPGSATRTTGYAELVMVELGGDLADRRSADRLARWLIETIEEPAPFEKRTSPMYLLDVQLVSSLAGIIAAASMRVQRQAIELALGADEFGDQVLLERSWVRMLVGVSPRAWTGRLASAAFDAGRGGRGAFDRALVGCAALAGHPDARRDLLEKVAAGDSDSLWGLGPIPELPSETVSALASFLTDELRSMTRAYRAGRRVASGSEDPVRLLALVGAWHPEAVDWATLMKLLAEPTVPERQKRGAMHVLTWGGGRLPAEAREKLAHVARLLISRSRRSGSEPADRDLLALCAIVAASLAALSEPDHWLGELLAEDRRRRRFGAVLAAKLGRPEDIGTLGALTADGDPRLRAAATMALAQKLAAGDDTPAVRELLGRSLDDPGRAVPHALANAIDEADFARALTQIGERRLEAHPAASVRLALAARQPATPRLARDKRSSSQPRGRRRSA